MFATTVHSQEKRNKVYEDYINLYKDAAVSQMKKYNIPASITLAQGLLESGAGKGTLAKSANNHFGIKCNSDWTGEKVYKDDDNPNDCFRKYKKAEESFDDHAVFLGKPRYKDLFSLDITDYKNWAKGLQQSGYATDKAYANKLIKLIEDYEIYQFDKKGFSVEKIKQIEVRKETIKEIRHTPYKTHDLVYVVAEDGDTYGNIAAEFSLNAKDIAKYNEVSPDFPLKKGDLVYLEKKKTKADKPYYEHVVQIGESMHSISQLYGIKLDYLLEMNNKGYEYTPVEGVVLKLR
ncbi:MAG: glucosaminidase domain-containing protein [Prevotella sp.]|nr:glucosaminidase domain-containing protein [Prevotella sp.]